MPQDKTGRVAQCEDYDSDESRIVEGTVVTASAGATQRPRSQQQSSSRPRTAERSHRGDATNNSGQPSHASAQIATTSHTPAAGSTSQPPTLRRLSTASPTKSKPVIHRVDSARSGTSARQQSGSRCSDPYCNKPGCALKPNIERRYTLSSEQPHPQSTQAPTTSQHRSAPQHHYQAVPVATPAMMMPPPPLPQPESRPRQPRPVSIHAGYPSYSGSLPGPLPASSAYYYQNYQQPSSSYYGTTPPTQTSINYPPQSPSMPSPSSPNVAGTYPGFPGYAGPSAYSTRQANPAVPGLDFPKVMPHLSLQPGLSRAFSARTPNVLTEPESTETESDSASSESDISETEEDYQRRLKNDRRKSRAPEDMVAVVPSRRPSVRDSKRYRTETAVSMKSRRESLRLEDVPRSARRSDTGLDYPSSSDRNDSDRTARATISERRSTTSSARGSRRPSVSTTASSGRTKDTSLSSGANEHSRVIIEDSSGRRRTAYLSKEQQSDLIRRMEQAKLNERWDEQRLTEEKVAAYQRSINGGEPYELSAQNVKDINRKSGSHSLSHVSRRSQRSGGSGSKLSRSDGIVIQTGGTVLHIHGESSVQVRPGEDGGSAQITIGSVSGRDSGYHGSKSSSSRVERSRGGSEFSRRGKIREEVEYDSAGYEVAR
ncbi:hypothetical protein DOTSEDRAFT_33658 [Dothistroma septosporum NZE10]|uniref:Uncharacterized protein n=1 Tax=Dothistroma septosporum (strain NZE10 / CBS 128990) TaxID=675120 RepID=N1PNT4_DOTSN|nr:hypothetical protein DOTSEDRAFT_33658 [Dothistroma septosporum NZE10]